MDLRNLMTHGRCRKQTRLRRPSGSDCLAEHCVKRPKKRIADLSMAGRDLDRNLRVAELELQVHQLTQVLKTVLAIVDHDAMTVKGRLQKKTPRNAILRVWAKESEQPAHLADQQEERPW